MVQKIGVSLARSTAVSRMNKRLGSPLTVPSLGPSEWLRAELLSISRCAALSRYDLSPIIYGCDERADRGERMVHDPMCKYTPRVEAGSRLPNCVLGDGRSFAKILSPLEGFTLLCVRGSPAAPDGVVAECAALLADTFAGVPDGHARRAPVPMRVIEIDYASALSPELLNGTHRLVGAHFAKNGLVLVRPDRYVAFALSANDLRAPSFEFSADDAAAVCARVAGWDTERAKVALARASNEWLTERFHHAIFPLRFIHTSAIHCINMPKEEAVARVRAKAGAGFTAENKLDTLNDTGTIIREDDHISNMVDKERKWEFGGSALGRFLGMKGPTPPRPPLRRSSDSIAMMSQRRSSDSIAPMSQKDLSMSQTPSPALPRHRRRLSKAAF